MKQIIALLLLCGTLTMGLFAQGADVPATIAVAPDGYIFITGTSMSAAGKMDIVTLAYDPNGRLQGSKRVITTVEGAGIPTGIIVQGNTIIVTGMNPEAASGYDIVTVSYTRSQLVSVEQEHTNPTELTLDQSYPNPLSSTGQEATITFLLPERALVKLSVVDNLGKEVAILVDEVKEQGRYQMQFNPSSLPSGTYYYVLQSRTTSIVKKLMVIR